MNKAQLDWQLDVQCPKCEEYIDLTKNDDDCIVSSAIFNNNWDALKGFDVTCKCGHEFQLDGVEY
jgi:hypothetical protein